MAGRSSTQIKMPPVKYSVTRLGGGVTQNGTAYPGGLDLTTPSLALQPGALRDVLNFECSQSGGYARIDGYERLDGRPKPHLASYTIVQVDAFTNLPAVNDTLTQASSGATGVVCAVNNIAGAYYVAVTKVTGLFDGTGAVAVGATPIGTQIAQTAMLTAKQTAQYTAAAADTYRADIGAVPGSGNVLGVVGMIFSGVDHVYAFRANLLGTAVLLYKATSGGWTLVPFFNTVNFTAGSTAEALDGDVLTQGGVSAVIKRVMWQSGTWTGSSAVGTFVVVDPTGGNFSSGAATCVGSGATVTLAGAQTPITLATGGHYQFDKANFSGQLVTRRIYGCDGANKCFEFDGETYAPISTGLTDDTPSNICAHKNYLFVSKESSILYCGVGTPFKWNSIDGGGEIATGDTVTGLITLPGSQTTGTLGVLLRGNTAFLYGTSPTTFNYTVFNSGTGALQFSTKNLFDTLVFDDIGVITLQTTLNFGNFSISTLTKNIFPFIQQERNRLVASSLNRSKSQYRTWFNDGYGLWLTVLNQQYLGASLVYFPNPVLCADETDLADGGMTSYFGSSDGYVYELDVGTSFDGGNIDAYIRMAWDPIKSPRILKRFRAASIEMQGGAYAEVYFGYQLGYGSPNISQPANVNYASNFSGAPIWDTVTMIWDSFVWDGRTLLPTDVDMTGTGENVQVIISSTGNYIASYNVNSIIYHYTPRRGMRV